MTNEQLVREIQKRQQTGGDTRDLMETLWKQNYGFIWTKAKECFPLNPIPDEDTIQEGYLALIRAVNRYDAERGVLFLSFFGYILMSHWQREIIRQNAVITVPEYMRTRVYRYKRFIDTFEEEYKRIPTAQEVCDGLQISREQLGDIKRALTALRVTSTEAILSENPDGSVATLSETIADEQAEESLRKVLDEVERAGKRKAWKICGVTLKDKELRVLRMRYEQGMTFSQIGETLGFSAQFAQQIHKAALDKLRKDEQISGQLASLDEQIAAKAFCRTGFEDFARSRGDVETLVIDRLRKENDLLSKAIRNRWIRSK